MINIGIETVDEALADWRHCDECNEQFEVSNGSIIYIEDLLVHVSCARKVIERLTNKINEAN